MNRKIFRRIAIFGLAALRKKHPNPREPSILDRLQGLSISHKIAHKSRWLQNLTVLDGLRAQGHGGNGCDRHSLAACPSLNLDL